MKEGVKGWIYPPDHADLIGYDVVCCDVGEPEATRMWWKGDFGQDKKDVVLEFYEDPELTKLHIHCDTTV